MRTYAGLLAGAVTGSCVVSSLLLGTGGVAAARADTCHGRPATIVGSPGAELHGTDGPDVVVTNGAADADTGPGDDLVCVTGGAGTDDVDVTAGDGADVVDSSASLAHRTRADLGAGDDTYTGAPGADLVLSGDAFASPPGQGTDTVAAGDGEDLVLTGGAPGSPDHDLVDLGPGNDDAWLQGPVDPTRPIQGGEGADQLELDRTTLRDALVIDNSVGVATVAGAPAIAWTGMERFRLSPIGRWSAPSFVGGAGPDHVWSGIPLRSVDLGGGDDSVKIELHRERLVNHARYVGGPGADSISLNAGAGDDAQRVALDVPRGRLLYERAREAVRARIHGFEAYRLSAQQLDVRGGDGADHVKMTGCHGTVDGGPGKDLIEAISIADVGCGVLGADNRLVVRGGPGDDVLRGNYMPDTLLGGAGHDVADGRQNHDTCVAERTVHCES